MIRPTKIDAKSRQHFWCVCVFDPAAVDGICASAIENYVERKYLVITKSCVVSSG